MEKKSKIKASRLRRLIRPFLVPPGKKVSLQRDYDPAYKTPGLEKETARAKLEEGIRLLAELQDKLYAQNNYALLIILQAMDAAGKDGVIKHVMSGLNPQGTQVTSFKAPSSEELDHDYLWRCMKVLPERGRIGIFNRSYYEEVLITKVHPEILKRQQLPSGLVDPKIWDRRYEEINHFEKYLAQNGIVILKFFLNVSKEEQRQRFLARIERPEKNWKVSPSDIRERAFWKDYQKAFEEALNRTSTPWAPWHVIPADRKWFCRIGVAAVIAEKLLSLGLKYPAVGPKQFKQLREIRDLLKKEG